MLSAWLETHQSFVISEHKTHDVFEKIKKNNKYSFQKIVHRVKKFTFRRKKLKTKEKKKTEIKREKHLFQPKVCKFKETLDCRKFLELYQNVSMYVGVVSSCCFHLSISF